MSVDVKKVSLSGPRTWACSDETERRCRRLSCRDYYGTAGDNPAALLKHLCPAFDDSEREGGGSCGEGHGPEVERQG